jgi:hypothetical protein
MPPPGESAIESYAPRRYECLMKALILLVLWCILFVLYWPLALLVLVLLPFVWLISLPIRLLVLTVNAAFALLRALLFLPARLLGFGRARARAG